MSVVNFPTKQNAVEEAVGDFNEAVSAKRVRAVVIITLEDGEREPSIRVKHGWDDEKVTAMELLALAAGIEHSSRVIHDIMESS